MKNKNNNFSFVFDKLATQLGQDTELQKLIKHSEEIAKKSEDLKELHRLASSLQDETNNKTGYTST